MIIVPNYYNPRYFQIQMSEKKTEISFGFYAHRKNRLLSLIHLYNTTSPPPQLFEFICTIQPPPPPIVPLCYQWASEGTLKNHTTDS
uniref:Uncharacterized protein n=1 Tax=Lepeophtheirus salmonis TaxID=72036 RepID=A0A0K2U1F0_LEPSM